MLSKKNRVPRHLFPIILIKGKNYSSLNMYMRVACLPDRKESSFSFIVSKKAAKLAVKRNNIRRIGYNLIQKNISHIKEGFLVAVFIKKGAVELSKKELEEELLSLLQKANLLKTKREYDQKNNH